MTKQFLLYGHTGSFNHGAEALTRCTINLLRRECHDVRIAVSTQFPDQDKLFNLPADELIGRDLDGKTNEEVYAATIRKIHSDTVCLSMGGDLYCYRNWQRWATIHYRALECGALSVLWSCSIDPDVIDTEMLAALRSHHLITAREGITYNALRSHGIANVVKVSDIAFTLEKIEYDLGLDNYIVINVSPLVLGKNKFLANAIHDLLHSILKTTDHNIVLLPHVMASADNDYEALQSFTGHNRERVVLVSDKLMAAQYKHIISNARLCIASRTHVAIAAYSSAVPTLAIGYSTKSRGIAADLGMAKYRVDVESIRDLSGIFADFVDDEEEIRISLRAQIPKYIAHAINSEAVKTLTNW